MVQTKTVLITLAVTYLVIVVFDILRDVIFGTFVKTFRKYLGIVLVGVFAGFTAGLFFTIFNSFNIINDSFLGIIMISSFVTLFYFFTILILFYPIYKRLR